MGTQYFSRGVANVFRFISTTLFSIGNVISQELLCKENGKSANSIQRACLAFFLGGVTCSIRFTCLAAYIPMGMILALQQQPRSFGSTIKYLVGACAFPGLSGFSVTLLIDRAMYGFWAIPFLGNIHFNVVLGKFSFDRCTTTS